MILYSNKKSKNNNTNYFKKYSWILLFLFPRGISQKFRLTIDFNSNMMEGLITEPFELDLDLGSLSIDNLLPKAIIGFLF